VPARNAGFVPGPRSDADESVREGVPDIPRRSDLPGVTTVDGTQYYFGRGKATGGTSSGDETKSTWTVPVVGNNTGSVSDLKDAARAQRYFRLMRLS